MRFFPLFLGLLLPICLWAQQAQRISAPGLGCIDPEVYSERHWLAFQTGSGHIWLGKLDSLTGTFSSNFGMNVWIDSSDVTLLQSFNGPEFGWDAQSWSLVYTKRHFGVPQPWQRTNLNNAWQAPQPKGSGSTARLSVLATKDSLANQTWIAYGKGPSLSQGLLAYTSVLPQAQETVLDSLDEGARWITGEEAFVYIPRIGPWQGQVVKHQATDGTETLLVQDSYNKSYAYGWWAPEFNDIAVLAIINDSLIGVYAPQGNGNYALHSLEKAPQASGSYRFFGSPEAFVCGGKSYITTVLKEQATTSSYVPAQVWVLGIEPLASGQRIEIRADNGQDPVIRTDPESYVGKDQAFSVYNVIQGGVFEIWSCATGISTQNTTGVAMKNDPTPLLPRPNPVESEVFLPLAYPENQWVRVVSPSGQSFHLPLENGYLFTKPWKKGMYSVEFMSKSGSQVVRLIK